MWLHRLAAGYVPPVPMQTLENCVVVGCSEELGFVLVLSGTGRMVLSDIFKWLMIRPNA